MTNIDSRERIAARPLTMTVHSADAREIATVRRELVEWLAGTPLSDERASDVALACYEAMANVVEHAYASGMARSFELSAAHHRLAGRIAVTITDHGTWRTPDSDPGFRGHGMTLLAALSDHADVLTDKNGTVVHLSWELRSPHNAGARCTGSLHSVR
ncbi:ATP-binding protein [Antrihabitans sp. YC2-6]|uniref:ATP-binding protein n=1 Tax=Antrihabitans sp. YC2-6 TaxID=2799498 RepID=UPI0018F48EA1|nr:ATP-binding protein [Antrihabitans sp. YC2-6]MBJ8345789.1 ATP-binding protein [Antrihabitans sp. YC2-6]